MIPEKQVDLLLDAFGAMEPDPGKKLWIIGDGPDRDCLKKHAVRMGLANIHFFGRIIEGADSYFAAADFFVLPGVGGLALNQAMFWGVPCICSEADGTEDDLVIEGFTGLRFETGKAESLAESLGRAEVIKDTPAYAKMQKEARRLILERSNIRQMAETFRRVICGEHENPPGS